MLQRFCAGVPDGNNVIARANAQRGRETANAAVEDEFFYFRRWIGGHQGVHFQERRIGFARAEVMTA